MCLHHLFIQQWKNKNEEGKRVIAAGKQSQETSAEKFLIVAQDEASYHRKLEKKMTNKW